MRLTQNGKSMFARDKNFCPDLDAGYYRPVATANTAPSGAAVTMI